MRARAAVGFPAHAGMDPHPGRSPQRYRGFPRPRGDGPGSTYRADGGAAVSPPTRGWTRRRRTPGQDALGFPAHAGMDLSYSATTRNQRRFPRPRGDGPPTGMRTAGTVAVSPPTRGWTLYRMCRLLLSRGFPAHAGMDRSYAIQWPRRKRFPRPRGDGPQMTYEDTTAATVSPPTRGWTHMAKIIKRRIMGFPAHAGMDPDRPHGRRARVGFPRPRGDGPSLLVSRTPVARVSPPTRGWTLLHPLEDVQGDGFPAHAGMDRRRSVSSWTRRRFPRPRGDGPQSLTGDCSSEAVSPPTRGWTALVLTEHSRITGFPAHAGMDPEDRVTMRLGCGFPRPRGDGPSSA